MDSMINCFSFPPFESVRKQLIVSQVKRKNERRQKSCTHRIWHLLHIIGIVEGNSSRQLTAVEHNKRLHNARFINHTARTMAQHTTWIFISLGVWLLRLFSFNANNMLCVSCYSVVLSPSQHYTYSTCFSLCFFTSLQPSNPHHHHQLLHPETRRISLPPFLTLIQLRDGGDENIFPLNTQRNMEQISNIIAPTLDVREENYFSTHSIPFSSHCSC